MGGCGQRSSLRILVGATRVGWPLHRVMRLSHPLAVQFTPEQLAWLDGRRIAGLSRSAVVRLVVEEAMKRDQSTRAGSAK